MHDSAIIDPYQLSQLYEAISYAMGQTSLQLVRRYVRVSEKGAEEWGRRERIGRDEFTSYKSAPKVILKNNDYWLKHAKKKLLAILQNLIKEKDYSPCLYHQERDHRTRAFSPEEKC